MNPFAAHQRRERKEHDLSRLAEEAAIKEKAEREKACMAEIITVMDKHECELTPVLRYLPMGVVPDLQLTAKDKKPDEPKPEQPTGADASIAGAAKADEQATTVGEPIAPSKVVEAPQAPAHT